MKNRFEKQVIFLIDSRGIIRAENGDAQRRHKEYAYEIFLINPKSVFYIISAAEVKNEKVELGNYHQTYIKSNKRFSLKYVFEAVNIIKSFKNSSAILLAGDPWESAFNARVISFLTKYLYRIKLPIQVQIHADITDSYWRKNSLANQIRFRLAAFSLRKADQIRAVTENMKSRVSDCYSIDPKKVFVSSVELNFPKMLIRPTTKIRPRSIGFAGRFHKDRAIEEFIEFVRIIDPNKNDIRVILAGDGDLLKDTLSQLKEIMMPERIHYCGNLVATEMHEFWEKVGVYVSLAKSESYGRSIREAMYLGIPVLGAKSSGFDITMQLNVPWISHIDLKDQPHDLLIQLESMFQIHTDDSAKLFLQREAIVSKRTLVDSWNNLLNA